MKEDRYDRQRRLPGVGGEGQLRIEESEAGLPSGPSASTALAYLVRAGVERGAISRTAAPEFPHAPAFRFQGPKDVARGAHQALRHLLHVVRNQ